MKDTYKYEAFISYRHVEKDSFVAEQLHKALEEYKLGRKFKDKKIKRIFRDKDELPISSNLNDPITDALNNSEFLIIICSPQYLESKWCKRELEVFLEKHDKSKVITVLCEGEPNEAFPDEMLYEERKENDKIVKVPVEPLAADVRGENKKEIKKKINIEKLRILAQMIDVNFDDLKQRHRERKMRRAMVVATSFACVGIFLGVASTLVAFYINKQNVQIESQNKSLNEKNIKIEEQYHTLLLNQSDNLAESSLELLAEGDVLGAIDLSLQALTQYNGADMPYNAKARYALAESLRIYDDGASMKALARIEMDGEIGGVVVSEDKSTFLVYDSMTNLVLWNAKTGDKIKEFNDFANSYYDAVIYIDNNTIAYINDEDMLKIFDIEKGKVIDELYETSAGNIYSSYNTDYFVVELLDCMSVYKKETLDKVCTIDEFGSTSVGGDIYFNKNELIISLVNEINIIDLEKGIITDKIILPEEKNSVMDIDVLNGKINILTTYADEDFNNRSTSIYSYDDTTKKQIWSKTYSGIYGSKFAAAPDVDTNEILFYSSNDIIILNDDNGEEIVHDKIGSFIAGLFTRIDGTGYILFTTDGEYGVLNGDTKETYILDYRLQCTTDTISNIYNIELGFMAYTQGDNFLTIYNDVEKNDRKEYDRNLENESLFADFDSIIAKDVAREKAKELGIEKSSVVNDLFYNEDKSVIFVSYIDESVEVYNAKTMKLIESVKDGYYVDWVIGRDRENNIYVAGEMHGLCFDENYNLIARIPYLREVKEDVLVVGTQYSDKKELYTIPIYSLDELIEMGKERLG